MSKQDKVRLVPYPSGALVPERDVDKPAILDCRHLGIDFGGLTAVDDFSLLIGRTEIAGLIGPNGAGKVATDTRYEKLSTDRSDCRLSFASPVGLLLSCNHIYNQYVLIDNSCLLYTSRCV